MQNYDDYIFIDVVMDGQNMKGQKVTADMINEGDTILMNETGYTVQRGDIQRGFGGWVFRMQSCCGESDIKCSPHRVFTRVLFKKYREGKFMGYVTQQ